MPGITELANMSLGLLGQQPLDSYDDATTTARMVRVQFWQVADEVMEAHVWKFAHVRSPLLAVEASPPSHDYAYRFALPTDPYCLRVLGTHEDDDDWSVAGRFVLSNHPALKIDYLGRVVDTATWPARFTAPFCARLAWKLAYSITQSMAAMRDMAALYDLELTRGQRLDGQERAARTITSSTLTRDVR